MSTTSPTNGPEANDASFDAAWQNVMQAFEDERRHDEFIWFARQHGALHLAARKYRELQDDPERGSRATAKLKTVSFLVTHELLSSRTEPVARGRRWLWLMAAAGLVTILTVLVALLSSC